MLLATAATLTATGTAKVYVLLCENECYYVGFSQNVKRRINQHFEGCGAYFTKINKPLSVVEIIDAIDESDEFWHWTKYAKKYGPKKVGGYSPWMCAEKGFVWPFNDNRYHMALRSVKGRKVNLFK